MSLCISPCGNSLAPEKFEWKFRNVILKRILVIDGRGISCQIGLIWMSLGDHWWSVNIGSCNGLVPPGNKLLPEPILSQFSCHMASLGHSELNINSLWPYDTRNISTGSSNGLLPYDTIPLHEPMFFFFIINGVLLYSPYNNFTGSTQDINS